MQLSGLKLHYVNWNRLINCGVKLMLLDQLFIYFQVDLIEYVGYLLVELSSWFFINTFKQRKSFVIGVSCLQVRVLCVLISVKSLFTKFIWTTEKLSDWWFKISGIRWYHWQFIVQNDSAKVESAINLFFKYKAYCMATVGVAVDVHLIGAEVAMPSGLVYWAVIRRSQTSA